MENINHKNYFNKSCDAPVKEAPKAPVKEAPKAEEPVVEKKKVYTVEELYALDKQEQIDKLTELGLSKSDIKGLKFEEDRVEELYKLLNE